MLKPIGKNILVKPQQENEKKGFLILNKNPNDPFNAEVVDIGEHVEIEICKGDILLLRPYSGEKITHDNETYLLIQDMHVMGIIT